MCFNFFKFSLFKTKVNSFSDKLQKDVIDHKTEFPVFLELIKNKCKFHYSTLVMSLIYLERIKRNLKLNNININTEKIYLYYFVGCIVSDKYLEEYNYSFRFLSSKTGYSKKDLVKLEQIFLEELDWDLFVSDSEFFKINDLLIENSICFNFSNDIPINNQLNNNELFRVIDMYLKRRFLLPE